MTERGANTTNIGLRVVTALGSFTVSLATRSAPHTCDYFLGLAKNGALDDGAIFRITTRQNRPAEVPHPIHIVQLGTRRGLDEERSRVPHEDTGDSGLRHKRWTVSASRFEPGELYASFFVCLRDEPALDAGGGRRADARGYAAFGSVVHGTDVVEDIYGRAESEEVLRAPIAIHRVEPVSIATPTDSGTRA